MSSVAPVRDLVLPQLYCPDPADERNLPHVDSLGATVLRWFHERDLLTSEAEIDEYTRAQFADLTARVCPQGKGERLEAVMIWFTLAFRMDDLILDTTDDPVRRIADAVPKYLRVVDDPHAPLTTSDPLLRAFRDFQLLMRDLCTANQWFRLADGWQGYFLASLWKAVHVESGRQPSPSDYTFFRAEDSALMLVWHILEVGADIDLPQQEFITGTVRSLARMAANIGSWLNDIYSYPKEILQPNRPSLSLPTVLAEHHQLTHQGAIDAAARLHDEETRKFMALADEVALTASPQTIAYVSMMRHCIRGNYDWERLSGRYTGWA